MKRSDSEMSDMSDMPGMRLDANLLVNEGRDFIEFDSPWKNGGGGRLSGSEGGDGGDGGGGEGGGGRGRVTEENDLQAFEEHLKASDATAPDALSQWNFQSTLALWASIFFTQGAVLFSLGSVGMFPGVLHAEHFKFEAWVDYSFVIGAWLFTLGNYIVYFQVINERRRPAGLRSIYCVRPKWNSRGHLASVCNLVGALLYNANTMSHFFIDLRTTLAFNVWYVSTGVGGSLLFVVGAILEGEHNNWRSMARWKAAPVPLVMGIFNFIGGVCFLVGYASDTNRYSDVLCAAGDCSVYVGAVCAPNLIGSVSFLVSSFLMIMMWKAQSFGLGFCENTMLHSSFNVDFKQQGMIAVYILNCCLAWFRLGFLFANPHLTSATRTTTGLDIGFKLLVFHCVLALVSAIHTTPKRAPFNYLLWSTRFIAVYGLAAEIYTVVELNSSAPHFVNRSNHFVNRSNLN